MPIFVKSNKDGFRRCGVAHTREGREFADDVFTEEQIKIMNDDPDIMIVSGVPVDNDKGGDGKGQPGKKKTDPDEPPSPQALIDAAKKAIEGGNTTGSGSPLVDAMSDILNFNVTGEMRNQAWMAIQEENKD